MEMLNKLSRETQIILGAAVLYLIFSFLDWQQVSFLNVTAGRSEWVGIGIIAGLLVIALLIWEVIRALEVNITLGSLTPGLISAALALLLLLFTVITFLTHNEARHWPAWVGLLLSIVIAVAAFIRAKAEGVTMPDFKAMSAGGTHTHGTHTHGGTTTPPPAGTTPPPGETPGPGATTPGP
jgi:hypothetical protein